MTIAVNAPNPLDTFLRNFRVDWEVANVLRTCYGETGLMDFGLKPVATLWAKLATKVMSKRILLYQQWKDQCNHG